MYLEQLKKEYETLLAQKGRLVDELASDKFFKSDGSKRAKRKAINEIEREIKRIFDLIQLEERRLRQVDRNDMREIGFKHGIDTRSNQFGHVSKMVENVSSALSSSIIGKNSSQSGNTFIQTKQGSASINPLFIGVGLVALLFIFKK
ncbi:MAG: hypothetical protein ACK5B9_03620 [Flavobacteriia bacterium]|jgi:hypothetical protein